MSSPPTIQCVPIDVGDCVGDPRFLLNPDLPFVLFFRLCLVYAPGMTSFIHKNDAENKVYKFPKFYPPA